MALVAERALKWRSDRTFYTGMAIAVAVPVLVGFARTFYLRGYLPLPLGTAPLTSLLVVHGVVNSLWFALFLTQTLLVARSRTDIHRRLGVLGVVLAIAVVAIGTITTITAVRHRTVTPEFDPRVFFLGGTLPSFILFGVLVAAAVAFRRRPETHKRLMLLATIKLMSAGLDRVFVFNFDGPVPNFLASTQLATDIFIIAAVVYDLRTLGARASGRHLGWRGGHLAAATACGGGNPVSVGSRRSLPLDDLRLPAERGHRRDVLLDHALG